MCFFLTDQYIGQMMRLDMTMAMLEMVQGVMAECDLNPRAGGIPVRVNNNASISAYRRSDYFHSRSAIRRWRSRCTAPKAPPSWTSSPLAAASPSSSSWPSPRLLDLLFRRKMKDFSKGVLSLVRGILYFFCFNQRET